MINKVITNQDAYYKWVKKISGETSINLSQEIANFIVPDYVLGVQKKVAFTIFKDDFLRALGIISNSLPLFRSTSQESVQVEYSNSLFEKYYNIINGFFGKNEKAKYVVNFISREDGRFYLNNLDNGGFNVREFLIAFFSVLSFDRVEGELFLRLENGPSNEKANQMTREERLEAFFDYIESHKTGKTIKNYKKAATDTDNINTGKPIQDNIVKLGFPGTLIDITDLSKIALLYDATIADPNNKLWNQTCSATIGLYRDFLISLNNIPKKNIDVFARCLDSKSLSRQLIYFGAPGTSKSTSIKRDTKDGEVHRITFHPDTDYSNFVGCYKPIKREDGNDITYEFVAQAFTIAYVSAWKQLAKQKKVYLVIEEINRGNCAQIFGDIFQLLDRGKDGFSDYTIEPDSDLQDYLKKQFLDDDLPVEIKNGSKMQLPPNLYIWATMNTSDQSLFPIDSAFKRRWEWKYMPITKPNDNNHKIRIGNVEYDWWEFLVNVNERIESLTESEDKQLGYWFARPKIGDYIDMETFVGKVVFYLWNDIFKDFGEDERSPFMVKKVDDESKKEKVTFRKFFNKDTGEIDDTIVVRFIESLGLTGKKVEKDAASSTETTTDEHVEAERAEGEAAQDDKAEEKISDEIEFPTDVVQDEPSDEENPTIIADTETNETTELEEADEDLFI